MWKGTLQQDNLVLLHAQVRKVGDSLLSAHNNNTSATLWTQRPDHQVNTSLLIGNLSSLVTGLAAKQVS